MANVGHYGAEPYSKECWWVFHMRLRFKSIRTFSFALLVVWLPTSSTTRSLGKNVARPRQKTDITPEYPNTADGLQRLIQDVLLAAKNGDAEGVTAFVKSMEIPNCDVWLHKMYKSDQADSWTGMCRPNERPMQELLTRLGKQQGEVLIRKVNDNPEPGHGMEWGWLGSIRQPLDIYFASWKIVGAPKDYEVEPIGYFMYVEGGFRWDSLITTYKPSDTKHTNAKVAPYKLIKKVDPVYPPDADSRGIGGAVRVYFTIGADGIVYNAHAISGDGLSDDPSLRKAAEDAVRQWRWIPLTVDGKPAQGETTVDLVFVPTNKPLE
jgi:TonB family protein